MAALKKNVLGLLGLAMLTSQCRAVSSRSTKIFEMNNFNSYGEGDAPDSAHDFDALQDGCFGAIRDGSNCVPSKPNDALVEKDPESSDNKVMKVAMKAGTYGTEQKHAGMQFYTKQLEEMSDLSSATLEYEVYFPDDFEWTLGGKLPGLHGGDRKCSGGYYADGTDCFSTRLMWREDGAGEAYLYLPMADQESSFCSKCSGNSEGTTCSDIAHCSLNRGSFSFNSGAWNKIKMQVKLNSPGDNDGTWTLYHNDKKVMSEKLAYRKSSKVPLSGMFFSTFFGGDSSEYSPSSDQSLSFKDISLYAGIV
eukprot:CFRG2850T1